MQSAGGIAKRTQRLYRLLDYRMCFPYNCDRNYRGHFFFRLHRRKYHVVEEGLAEIEILHQLGCSFELLHQNEIDIRRDLKDLRDKSDF